MYDVFHGIFSSNHLKQTGFIIFYHSEACSVALIPKSDRENAGYFPCYQGLLRNRLMLCDP